MGLEVASFINDLVSANPPGGDGKSQGDDHLRLIKSVLKATFPNAVGALKFSSVDAGAGLDPNLILFRDSASPAALDNLGALSLTGRNNAAAEVVYGRIVAQITDPTAGSEDSTLYIQAMVAGVLTNVAILSSTSIPVKNTDFFASGNYTKTPGARFVQFFGTGAGAGSGGINGTSGTQTAVTAGGGSGFAGWTPIIDLTSTVAPVAFIIGAGGAAGDLNSNGGNGGTTSITINGVTYTWGGGVGSDFRISSSGFYSMEGGNGGTGSNLIGGSQQGTTGFGSSTDFNVTAGAGGGNLLGTGGLARHTFSAGASAGGLSGTGFGSGASGAYNNGTAADQLGAAGRIGFLRATEWF